MSEKPSNQDYSALAEIDRLVHEPARLAVMALLYVIESADFTFLVSLTASPIPMFSTILSSLGIIMSFL